MIITNVQGFKVSDVREYAWNSLRTYRNTQRVQKLLIDLHKIPAKHHSNARRQAEQIRYCLAQAEEYYKASNTVSPLTRPTLLYYSCMSLALAELLFKQDGNSNLERARQEHRHHGLVFNFQKANSDDLASTASALRARPLILGDGERKGTFELWHRTARKLPMIGLETVEVSEDGYTFSGPKALLLNKDERLPFFIDAGASFLECAQLVPELHQTLPYWGVRSRLARGKIERRVKPKESGGDLKLTIHPTVRETFEEVINEIRLPASEWGFSNYKCLPNDENPTSIVIRVLKDEAHKFQNFPEGISRSLEETFFYGPDAAVNEFGIYYLGLFICSNYSRYYPDYWARDIERDDALAHVIASFMDTSADRIPLLSLCEFSRTMLIPGF